MSRKNKKAKYKDLRASVSGSDYFGTIYDSMCQSAAYKSLSLGAKQFYTLCRVQSKSKHGRACLYKHALDCDREYDDNCFVFPASHLELYSVDRSNASRYFKELETKGFIRKKEKNKVRKKVNVYEFVTDWKSK